MSQISDSERSSRADRLQLFLLQTLSSSEYPEGISDTRKLRLPPQCTPTDGGDENERQLGVKGALDSLASKEMIVYKPHSEEPHVLTPEGSSSQPQEATNSEYGKRWATADQVIDQTKLDLVAIRDTGALPNDDAKGSKIADYRKRKLCEKRKYIYYSVTKGPKFATTIERPETDLTVELLQSGAWKTATFKPYNFNAEGVPPAGGALHPLMKVREEFRNIFFEMGFTEMSTDQYVESSFWCFDSLFVPQQHPARESQDTFYLKDPENATQFPEDYYKRVKQIHETGGYGSIGYRAPFKHSETSKLLLRTHTTSVSAAMLYKLANQEGGFKPVKMYSIDRVFRNEAVDATHLAEFHQVEGVVADYGITLGDLIGFMEVFFAKMGIDDIRVKPTYNPYTEPSMEIYSFHKGLNKWVEIGNSGMFRPEMLEPMGIPEGVRVLGWGLSLERPTMIKYEISNIRDLLGHKVSLESVQRAAAVRF